LKFDLKYLEISLYHTVIQCDRVGVAHECDRQTDRQTDRPLAIARSNSVRRVLKRQARVLVRSEMYVYGFGLSEVVFD